MSVNTGKGDVEPLIAGLQIASPKLYQAIMALQNRLFEVEKELNPLVRQATIQRILEEEILPPQFFSYGFPGTVVRFDWSAVAGAAQYEIRKGTVWETATFVVKTPTLRADIDPLATGSHPYLIKSITINGTYSDLTNAVTVVIYPIPAPIVKAQVVDNNVLITWTPLDDESIGFYTAAFKIAYYVVRRDGSEILRTNSTFAAIFELIAGVYTYTVEAVDVGGNVGAQGPVQVALSIPRDFVLEASRESTLGAYQHDATHFVYLNVLLSTGDVNYRYAVQSGFESEPTHFYYAELIVTSSLVNVIRMDGPKLLACWATQTFQNHFTSRSWNSPNDQVVAGYPIYIQPAALTGSYEETYDYGGIFENNIVTINWTQVLLTSFGVAVVVKMSVSDDGVNYTAYTTGASQFFASLRYLKFKLEFTCENDKALMLLSGLIINLNVKKEIDSGVVSANKDDAQGTQVNFNKAFKDVDSITLSVDSLEPVIVIYDFTDVPNPVGFKVFAFDTTGARITYPVTWMARGVV